MQYSSKLSSQLRWIYIIRVVLVVCLTLKLIDRCAMSQSSFALSSIPLPTCRQIVAHKGGIIAITRDNTVWWSAPHPPTPLLGGHPLISTSAVEYDDESGMVVAAEFSNLDALNDVRLREIEPDEAFIGHYVYLMPAHEMPDGNRGISYPILTLAGRTAAFTQMAYLSEQVLAVLDTRNDLLLLRLAGRGCPDDDTIRPERIETNIPNTPIKLFAWKALGKLVVSYDGRLAIIDPLTASVIFDQKSGALLQHAEYESSNDKCLQFISYGGRGPEQQKVTVNRVLLNAMHEGGDIRFSLDVRSVGEINSAWAVVRHAKDSGPQFYSAFWAENALHVVSGSISETVRALNEHIAESGEISYVICDAVLVDTTLVVAWYDTTSKKLCRLEVSHQQSRQESVIEGE